MIQHGIRIELSLSVNIQLKTPSGTFGGIKTQTWLAKNNTASIVNTEATLNGLGKREKQKQIDGRKIALQKPNKTIFLKKFVSLS